MNQSCYILLTNSKPLYLITDFDKHFPSCSILLYIQAGKNNHFAKHYNFDSIKSFNERIFLFSKFIKYMYC